jgi:hypothetical protein
MKSVRVGNCFATAVREEKHRIKSAPGPIALWCLLSDERVERRLARVSVVVPASSMSS